MCVNFSNVTLSVPKPCSLTSSFPRHNLTLKCKNIDLIKIFGTSDKKGAVREDLIAYAEFYSLIFIHVAYVVYQV